MKLWLLTYKDNPYDHNAIDRLVVAADSEIDAVGYSFVEAGIYVEYPCSDNIPVWNGYYFNDIHDQSWTRTPTIKMLSNQAMCEAGVICVARTNI